MTEEQRFFVRWLRSGASSIVEHGLFSITSVASGLWVARVLGEHSYAIYAMATAAVVLVVALHHALIAEPMMVLASSKFADRRDGYLWAIARIHLRAIPLVSAFLAALAGVGWSLGWSLLAEALLGLAISLPPILLMMALRRSASAELRVGRAAIGGGVNLLATLALLWMLARSNNLTIVAALAASGGAALATAALYALAWPRKTRDLVPVREIMNEHWRYGRPGIIAGVLAWVPHNVYYFFLPLVAGGLSAGATLRAGMNLIMPAVQINGALGLVLTSILTRQQRSSRLRVRQLVPFFAVFLAVDVLLGIALVISADGLVGLAYGNAYRGVIAIVPVLAGVPIVTGLCTVVRAWAFALDFPQAQLWSSLAYAITALCAVPFLSSDPLRVAALGILAAALAYLVVVTIAVLRKVSDGS